MKLLIAVIGALMAVSPAFAMTQQALYLETDGWASFNEMTSLAFNSRWWDDFGDGDDFYLGKSFSSVENCGEMELVTSFWSTDNKLSQTSVIEAEGETEIGEGVMWDTVWDHQTMANSFIGFDSVDRDGMLVSESAQMHGEGSGELVYSLWSNDDMYYVHGVTMGRPSAPTMNLNPIMPWE